MLNRGIIYTEESTKRMVERDYLVKDETTQKYYLILVFKDSIDQTTHANYVLCPGSPSVVHDVQFGYDHFFMTTNPWSYYGADGQVCGSHNISYD